MSIQYHRLLKRQLRKHFPEGIDSPEMSAFLASVDQSYQHYDGDRKMMERAIELSSEELLSKNKELEEKNATLDSFIYRISHDLKNPANNLLTMTQMMRDLLDLNGQPAVVSEILGHLTKSGEVLVKRIQELLEMSRMENQTEDKSEIINLKAMVDDVLESISVQYEESNAKIETDFAEVPNLYFGVENLHSILSNLISNAIKYRSPERDPVVRLRTRKEDGHVLLEIEDNGLGLDLEKDGARLFGMFNRMHNHVEGSGVGLYIVKRIVENKKGSISVSSKINQGSIFKIRLPDETHTAKVEVHSVG